MARINLLPWREAERKRRQRDFAGAVVAALAAAVLLALAVHFQMEATIAAQQGRNQYLQTQIAALDVQIKRIQELEATKANLIARMNVIQSLQKSRPEVVHLFDELVITVPEGIFLTKVEQSGKSVIVEGQAQSNARVSSFMRNIEASAWVGNPALQLIENKDQTGTGLSRFRLRFDQRQLGAEGDAGAANSPGGKPAVKPKAATPATSAKPQKQT
jgi:type IV pilus assembly protein PilN